MTYGETDEFGHRAATNVVTPNDFQATLFQLFGLDHRQLSYLLNGRDQQITAGREARVVNDIVKV
jgi:hypothetical protein